MCINITLVDYSNLGGLSIQFPVEGFAGGDHVVSITATSRAGAESTSNLTFVIPELMCMESRSPRSILLTCVGQPFTVSRSATCSFDGGEEFQCNYTKQ